MEPIKVWMGVCRYYGPSIWNVAEKYREYAPEEMIEWVDDWLEADVCIDHLIGTPDRTNLVHPGERDFSETVKARLEMAKMGVLKVAYVMHCAIVDDEFFREAFWLGIAKTGFLDPPSRLHEAADGYSMGKNNNGWIRVGWGVEPSDFLLPMREGDPDFLIYTFGASQDPEEECIRSIYEAVKEVGGKMLHSGLDYHFDEGQHYAFVAPATTKAEIASRYNSCWFANAMRQEDGFELANVEAPLSNARPITLQKPCYEHFFTADGCSLFVHPELVKMQLLEFFRNRDKYRVSVEDKRRIIERFNWRDAVTPFWERVIEKCRKSDH